MEISSKQILRTDVLRACCRARYSHPVFPHEDDIVHVGPWDVGNQPIADWCTYSIECQYEVSQYRETMATIFTVEFCSAPQGEG